MLQRLFGHRRNNQPLAAAQAPVIESLEERKLMADAQIVAAQPDQWKVITNIPGADAPLNRSRLTIPFSDDIVIFDVNKIQIRGWAINPISASADPVKVQIQILNAQVLNGNQLQLTTRGMICKDGYIVFNRGSFKDVNGVMVKGQERKTIAGLDRETFTLTRRMFIPQDLSRVTPDVYAGAPAPTVADDVLTEPQAEAQLDALLDKKVAQKVITQARADAAMAGFNSSAAIGIIPDHNLRAACYALTGTFAEGAIASFIEGENDSGLHYSIIRFGATEDPTVPVAQTTIRESDGALRITIRQNLSGEPLQALSAWLAHEAIHQDDEQHLQEEKIGTIAEVLVYAQQALVDPAFIKSGSQLVNLENEKLIALLNSGRVKFPFVGPLDPPNARLDERGVLPNSIADSDGDGVYTSFDNFVGRQYIKRGAISQNTNGNELLEAYITAITGTTPVGDVNFSDSLITSIDNSQKIVSVKSTISLARHLRLQIADLTT